MLFSFWGGVKRYMTLGGSLHVGRVLLTGVSGSLRGWGSENSSSVLSKAQCKSEGEPIKGKTNPTESMGERPFTESLQKREKARTFRGGKKIKGFQNSKKTTQRENAYGEDCPGPFHSRGKKQKGEISVRT